MCKGLLVEQWDVGGRMEERTCVISQSLHTDSGPQRVPRGYGPHGSKGFVAGANPCRERQ